MKMRASTLLGIGFFTVASTLSGAGFAAGLGNMTYTPAEYQKPISVFNGTTFKSGPPGSNTALMLRDYFIVMGSNDSGKPPGALHVFDVKDPRKPVLLKTLGNTPETNSLRELHAMPVAMIDGKDFLVMPTLTGIQFFDFTNPLDPKPSGALALTGVNGGDYDNAAWQVSWSWPYVFVGGTGNGFYIVDATDPARPTLVTRVMSGTLGNFRVGPIHAAGNYVVVSGMDQGPTKIVVLDVSNPRVPMVKAMGMAPAEMYAAVVIGDRIFGAGATGLYSFVKWSPTAITTIAMKKFGTDKGGYCTYQDGFAICGQSSEGYRKIDMRDDANIVEVGHADLPDASADTDFATVMGNLVYLGNDHGSGAAFIPHSMLPDTTAPAVVNSYPADQSISQPLSTRLTVFFSDEIDIGTITPTNMIVRKNGGAAVPGVFTHSSFNAISFGPRQPLEANSTYEVVMPAGGLKDLVGNAIKTSVTVRFSTGPTLAPPLMGTGGMGGSSAGSGGSGAGGAGGIAGGTGGTDPGTGGTTTGTGGASSGGASGGSGGALGSSGGST
ncbi:MAG: Ig-like domain-containing protein, partial [Pyrinomonadaceae bacterium]|nr:Ig-like domain-containing protein [Phycisphaerales bacterium]